MAKLDLAAHTVVITGGASGMGAALAEKLAARGAHLALVDHDAKALATRVESLPATTITTHVVDLRDDDAVFAESERIIAAHPSIRALVTCAGSSMLGNLQQLTMEEMRWLIDVNLWGTVSITKALLPALLKADAAHITHMASVYALAAPGGRIPYSMSKFAVRGFSEALRHELEGTNVTVGAVYPAGVRTGIILHGRYAKAIDPAIAARAAEAQAAMYRTEPDDAAEQILKSILGREPRTMVGKNSRLIDVLTRLFPVGHWSFMRKRLRVATDTTTPI